ncbi:MAG: alpha/beta fold hydrolase [Halieaceae bacterium]|nr:alpha/beta fold hydrolase [Halieaceae bacterium]
MKNSIRPFQINIPENELNQLSERLKNTRWPDAETVSSWDQGIPLDYAKSLTNYWINEYDWRRCEKMLNQWPNYMASIDDIDIHFIHKPSPHPDALPIIISHGWPGSVIEFCKVIDALTEPEKYGGEAKDAFSVVVPSLPGYGFSDKPKNPGTSVEKIGRMWGQLMKRIGYKEYVAQGGDWGAIISQSMAITEVGDCKAIHLNMPIVMPDPETMNELSEKEQSALAAMNYYNEWDSGYSKQQSTRPQTVAYGLSDSPVGQMSWIIEKFYSWTDCIQEGEKKLESVLTKDELLDNVMIFWLTNSSASSARLYWESFNNPNFDPINTPTGCSQFPKEIFQCSRRWAEKRFSNLIYWNELDRGGHFAAFERPDTFVEELRNCFRSIRPS